MPCKSAAVPAAVSSVNCRTLFSHWLRPGRRSGRNEPEDLPCVSRWENSRFSDRLCGERSASDGGTGCRTFVVKAAFAVAYDMMGMGPGYTFNPAVEFSTPVSPVSVRVANNTWTYLHLKGDYSDYSVSIIGFDGETQTGKVDVPLAANNKIVADWNTVGLDKLGVVTKIIFSVECSDKMAPVSYTHLTLPTILRV